MEFESRHQSNSELSVDCCEEPDWDAELLLQHAKMMSKLNEKMFEKAKANIDKAQKNDKEYYDMKHSDPKVCLIDISLYGGYTIFVPFYRNSQWAQLFF